MAIDSASITQNSNTIFTILQQAQQSESDALNNIAKIATAAKVAGPGTAASLPGLGEAVNVVA